MINPNIFFWNCRGARKKLFVPVIRDFELKYGFSILVFWETRISGERSDKVIRRIGFDGYYRVEANGFAGGIWAFRNSSI